MENFDADNKVLAHEMITDPKYNEEKKKEQTRFETNERF